MKKLSLALALLAAAGAAAAHPGHDADGLLVALIHAFGLEHLLMPVAIFGTHTTVLLLMAGTAAVGVLAGALAAGLWAATRRTPQARA